MRKAKHMKRIIQESLNNEGFYEVQSGAYLHEVKNGYELKNKFNDVLFEFTSLDNACHVLYGNS